MQKGEDEMQQVTIKDIARIAGVSVTTVSRALNHASEISEETRERILRICREQGYRTNLLARSLISSRTNLLGVILPDISSPFHATLALHIETYAQERGYRVMLCNGRLGACNIDELFEFLISQRVDGILLSSPSDMARALLSRYQSLVPLVLLGNCVQEESVQRINAVNTDNYAGGWMAAEYLHQLGHRNVAYLGYRTHSTTHTLRHQGFSAAAGHFGMQVETVENHESASSIESGYRMARQLFLKPFSQTAVFAASDAVALGAMQAADELGIPIPARLSVLGFDNIEYAALPKIRLTTLAQPVPALASAATQLLLDLIESDVRGVYTTKLLTPTLVQRDTCQSLEN